MRKMVAALSGVEKSHSSHRLSNARPNAGSAQFVQPANSENFPGGGDRRERQSAAKVAAGMAPPLLSLACWPCLLV